MFVELYLPGPAATEALGARLAQHLETGDKIALTGSLGAGKTSLARGLIRALLPAVSDVPSPTFTLLQTYETQLGLIWHFDLYRLTSPADLIELGWREADDGISLIEWPDRAGRFMPRDRLDVTLLHDAEGRRARLEAHGERWQERLHDF